MLEDFSKTTKYSRVMTSNVCKRTPIDGRAVIPQVMLKYLHKDLRWNLSDSRYKLLLQIQSFLEISQPFAGKICL
jgi:hypothetical protein